jgi:hypothetical protein
MSIDIRVLAPRPASVPSARPGRAGHGQSRLKQADRTRTSASPRCDRISSDVARPGHLLHRVHHCGGATPGRGYPRRPDPFAAPNANALRRAVRAVDPRRVPGPADSDWREVFPACRSGVRPALPRRKESPGNRQSPFAGSSVIQMTSRVRRRPRPGGLLNFYQRAA